MSLINFFSDMDALDKILWISDIILVVLMITILLLTFTSCFIRSLVNRFINLFYASGFILFVGTYFLIRNAKDIKDDGTIAIAIFIVIVCLILVKRMKDSNAKKEYP